MSSATRATLSWHSGLRFLARSQSGHGMIIDSVSGAEHLGPSPVELLLISLAGCTAMDVVVILQKMRERLTDVDVEIVGTRSDKPPRPFVAFEITYRLKGDRLTAEKVRRAVELSHSTYCSVLATLHPNCRLTTSVEIEPD
jgi:putative redox protein